jgi:hypothetical protein
MVLFDTAYVAAYATSNRANVKAASWGDNRVRNKILRQITVLRLSAASLRRPTPIAAGTKSSSNRRIGIPVFQVCWWSESPSTFRLLSDAEGPMGVIKIASGLGPK